MRRASLARTTNRIRSRTNPAAGLRGLLAVLLLIPAALQEANAQRPFAGNDPFYQSETARRVFHDGLAAAGEVAYRGSTLVPGSGLATSGSPVSLSLRLHYALSRRLDLNAYWNAAGTNTGPTIVLSWVGLKYYWTVDNADYAFRLAVDPASDGRVGFPQADVAFISTKGLSPLFSTDFAAGVRRVRKGFRQFIPAGAAPIEEDGLPDELNAQSQFIDTRALGMEIHFMWSYNTIFDPARSNVFIAFIGEGGQYELIETSLGVNLGADDEEGFGESNYRGGIVWLRSGIEFNRPSYQVIPFVSLPLKEWTPDEDGDASMHLGFRLMVR